jgi:hypothetical protein
VRLKPFVCQALRVLKLHRLDCKRCPAQDCYVMIHQRLAELNAHANAMVKNRAGENNSLSENDAS